jgi:hypothetical protein
MLSAPDHYPCETSVMLLRLRLGLSVRAVCGRVCCQRLETLRVSFCTRVTDQGVASVRFPHLPCGVSLTAG